MVRFVMGSPDETSMKYFVISEEVTANSRRIVQMDKVEIFHLLRCKIYYDTM